MAKQKDQGKKKLALLITFTVIFIILTLFTGWFIYAFGNLASNQEKIKGDVDIMSEEKVVQSAAKSMVPLLELCVTLKKEIVQPEDGGVFCSHLKETCNDDEEECQWFDLPEGYSYSKVENPKNSDWSFEVLKENQPYLSCSKDGCNIKK
jgi:hypothetical protein